MIGVERAAKINDSQQHRNEDHENKSVFNEVIPILPFQLSQALHRACICRAGVAIDAQMAEKKTSGRSERSEMSEAQIRASGA